MFNLSSTANAFFTNCGTNVSVIQVTIILAEVNVMMHLELLASPPSFCMADT